MSDFTPTPSKAQVLGSGCTLSIGNITGTSGAETFVPIGELADFSFDGFKRATTTATNFDSGNIVSYLGTLLDYSTLSGTYNRVSNNAGQLALLAALQTGAAYNFKLQLEPNILIGQIVAGDSYLLSAIVTEAGAFDLSQTKVSASKFSLQLNSVAFTAGS